MIKCIIFDFDGTLVDSKDVFVSVFNQLAAKYNFKKMKQADIEHLRKLSIMERCKLLNFPLYKLPFLASELHRQYKNHLKNLVLFDGIKELLDALKNRGFGLAIISSNSVENIKELLQTNHIDYINDIFSANNFFGKDKVIKKFLKVNQLKESEAIYIGDEQRDIVASKKNGVRVIWVGWGYDVIDLAKKEQPDFIVNTPGEILGVLQKLEPK